VHEAAYDVHLGVFSGLSSKVFEKEEKTRTGPKKIYGYFFREGF
jgi:hypothetical protein